MDPFQPYLVLPDGFGVSLAFVVVYFTVSVLRKSNVSPLR